MLFNYSVGLKNSEGICKDKAEAEKEFTRVDQWVARFEIVENIDHMTLESGTLTAGTFHAVC